MMDEIFEQVVVKTVPREKTATDTDTRPKRQPPYAVILHNDPVNGFDYVVRVLCKVFSYSKPKSFRLTLTAHLLGRSTVWVGALEVAEFKAEQLRDCGPDPRVKEGGFPLGVSLEPMPV